MTPIDQTLAANIELVLEGNEELQLTRFNPGMDLDLCPIFRKRAEKLGFAAARSSSIHRAGRIYRAHLVTLSFAFVLGSFFLSELSGIRNLLDSYLMNPWAAIGGSLAMLFRPPLMDILPMYVLFSFLTPAAFGAAKRWGWKTVLFVSFSVWVIAQTHVRDMLVNASNSSKLGPFDLLARQFGGHQPARLTSLPEFARRGD